MPVLAIVDDRRGARETVERNLELYLPEEWGLLGVAPLGTVEHYPAWIAENEIAAVIFDERLHEAAADSEAHVSYDGHDAVDFLRQAMPTLPIFLVTSYERDTEVAKRHGAVEDIISRAAFNRDPAKHLERILRSAQRYLENYESQLSEIGEISQRLATSEAAAGDIQRLHALREAIGLPFSSEVESRAEWLEQVEKLIEEWEVIRNEILDRVQADEVE